MQETSEQGWQKTLILGLLFAGWYSANVMFNMCVLFLPVDDVTQRAFDCSYNKQVLKSYPCPITCTCLQVTTNLGLRSGER